MQAEDRHQFELYNLTLPLTVCFLTHRNVCDCMQAGQLQDAATKLIGKVCADATSNTSQHTKCVKGRFRQSKRKVKGGFGEGKGKVKAGFGEGKGK